jgi:hypothetical protein
MRQRQNLQSFGFVFVLILLQVSAPLAEGYDASTPLGHHRVAAEEEKSPFLEECNAREKCQMCTFSDQKAIPACKETGRMQKFVCITRDEDGESPTCYYR